MGTAPGWLLLGVIATAGCSTMSVHSTFNPSATFSQYRTYAWLPNTDKTRVADLMRGSPSEQRLQSNVDQALAAKGITLAPAGTQPDFLISYHVATQEKMDVTDWGYGFYGFGGPVDAYTYTQGTLILDFVDPKTQNAFWRGYASDIVGDAGANGAKLDEAVTKMMQKYPPSPQDVASATQH
jgi:hypothetical protein